MTCAVSLYERVEKLVDPAPVEDEPELAAWVRRARDVLPPGRGAEIEASGVLPANELAALAADGLGGAFVPQDQGGALGWSRLTRICSRLAAHDLDFTLTLGGAVLGALPVLVAGEAHHRATYFAALGRGQMGGLGLTEWAHGSDILAGEVTAAPIDESGAPASLERATHFRLDGIKAPINNGTDGACLVILARTGAGDEAFAHSLFFLARPMPGLEPHTRFATLGHRAMDLGGAVLRGAIVPRAAMMGAAGNGFALSRRALEISRSGVAAMSLGPMATALSLALDHARARRLYGAPITELGGVRLLLGRSFARLVGGTALARRAARTVAKWAVPARGLSCAAKLVCPMLLEEIVADCGTLLGARSLMSDLPFARLRRSAPTLAIFDGSSQLQKDELWRHAAAWRAAGTLTKEDADAVLRTLGENEQSAFNPYGDDEGEVSATSPCAMLAVLASSTPELELAPIASLATYVRDAAARMRGAPQEQRFRVSDAAATIYAVTALAEAYVLADGDIARPAIRAALALYLADTAGSLAAALVAIAPARSDDALALLRPSADSAPRADAAYRALVELVERA